MSEWQYEHKTENDLELSIPTLVKRFHALLEDPHPESDSWIEDRNDVGANLYIALRYVLKGHPLLDRRGKR